MRTYLKVFALVVFLVSAGLIAAISFLVHKQDFRLHFTTQIQNVTGALVLYEKFEVRYLPVPHVRITALRVFEPGDDVALFTAQDARINIRIWPLLFGETRMGAITLSQAEWKHQFVIDSLNVPLELRGIDIHVGVLRPNKPAVFEMSASIGSALQAVRMKGTAVWEDQDFNFSAPKIFDISLDFKDFPLADLMKDIHHSSPFRIDQGKLSGNVTLVKREDENWIRIKKSLQFYGVRYHLMKNNAAANSPEFDSYIKTEMKWDPVTSEIQIAYLQMDFPIGQINVSGGAFLETRELHEIRIAFRDVSLESIPQYFLPLQTVIPFHVGFSGKTQLELSLTGTLDHLSIHGNGDLSQALLTYLGFFTKPKDVLFNVSFDSLLRQGTYLSADFSLKFEKTLLKGTVAEFDLKSGAGQVNIISNKFSLEGWENYLPPFSAYRLDGLAKILVNLKGDFRQWATAKPMINLTLDDANFVFTENQGGLHRVSLTADYGQLGLKIKDAKFEIGGEPVQMELRMQKIAKESWLIKGGLLSPALIPSQLIRAVRDVGKIQLPTEFMNGMQYTENLLKEFSLLDKKLENFSLKFVCRDKEFSFSDLNFSAYEGVFRGQGGMDASEEIPAYWLELDINKLSLARYPVAQEEGQPWIYGNLFMRSSLSSSGSDPETVASNLQGKGDLAVTNGEFASFDLVEVISEIQELKDLKKAVTGKTLFEDIRASFNLSGKKINTDNFVMLSDDLWLNASGEVILSDRINFRAGAYLAEKLTGNILPKTPAMMDQPGQTKRLGPIALLLSGPFQNPEVKLDETAASRLREALAKGGSPEIFRHFLPEELFFERPEGE